jgi:hypothetical protein
MFCHDLERMSLEDMLGCGEHKASSEISDFTHEVGGSRYTSVSEQCYEYSIELSP